MSPSATEARLFNFSAGPAVLPLPVLQQAQEELISYPGAGCSVMEISHRDPVFLKILHDAQQRVRQLLGIGDSHEVLFLQGGAKLQFSMVPANLLRGSGKKAHYMVTGTWSKGAVGEAKKEGSIEKVWDGAATNYDRLPAAAEYQVPADSAYLYYCSNETIQGVQFSSEPACPAGVPLVCDASSDFFSRPLSIAKYGILYACAQKNAGPAGVTVVIIDRDLLPRGEEHLPGYLLYRNHAENDSEWNTPPTFAIYMLGLVARWLQEDIGGLASMERINREKAAQLYAVVDAYPHLYQGHAASEFRSMMNVTFRLPSEEIEGRFLKGAAEHALVHLQGHRSVGGIRASIYNAMPKAGVDALAQFMRDFASSAT